VAKNKVIAPDPNNPKAPVVSNDTRVKEAWQLVNYLTTMPTVAAPAGADTTQLNGGFNAYLDPAAAYIKETGKPAARRDLIDAQKTDPMLSAFAWGNLIDKSWTQVDPQSDDQVLDNMIDTVNLGQADIHDAFTVGLQRITQLEAPLVQALQNGSSQGAAN